MNIKKNRHFIPSPNPKLLDCLSQESLKNLKLSGFDPVEIREQSKEKKLMRIRMGIFYKKVVDMPIEKLAPLKKFCYIGRDAAGRLIVRPYASFREHFYEYLKKKIIL